MIWMTRPSGFKRRVEGYRVLRSDGKPNFSNRVYRVEKDLEVLSTRPVVTATPTMPLIEALETMYNKDVRSLVVIDSEERYNGMLLVEHILSFLGGGDLYDIVVNRYNNDFYKSMNIPVSDIMDRDYPLVDTSLSFPELISIMVENDLNIVPVVHKDGKVYGVISEHDIVRLLAEKRTGVKAEDIMSDNIITVDMSASLFEANRTMTRTRVRRVFLNNEANQIIGALTAKKIIEYFGSHEAFKYVKKGFLEDVLSIPVKNLGIFRIYEVSPEDDVGDVASKMLEENIGAVLVRDRKRDSYVGMILEKDVFYALAIPLRE